MNYKKLDAVDLCLSLRATKWSSCTWVINDKSYSSFISHVIGEPYEVFIQALQRLVEGAPRASFQWYNEPGAERFTLERDGEYMNIVRALVNDDDDANSRALTFVTTEHIFLTICYLQLKKTALLMKDPHFAKGRQGNFPFRQFYDFEWQVRAYLGY